MSDDTPRALARIQAAAARTELRIRLDRTLRVGIKGLAVALVGSVVVLAFHKTSLIGSTPTVIALSALGVAVLAVALFTFSRPLPARAGAITLDRHHGLADRLSSALSFRDLPESERTPFMAVAIEDALTMASNVSPAKAAPIRLPSEWPVTVGLLALLVGVGLFEVRRHERIPPPALARMFDAVEVSQDDLDAMKEFLKELENKENDEDTKNAIAEFNKLIKDLTDKKLDRTDAFRKMQQLEDKLLLGREADRKALEEALQKLGQELKKAELTKPAGEALENKNLAKAQQELHDLAKKLREQGGKMDKAKLEQMRAALKKASAEHEKSMQELAQKRNELAQDLLKLKDKEKKGELNEKDRDELKKKERELDRLDRQMKEQEAAGRQLDRLDRELSEAAENLLKDMGLSAQDLEQGAEDLNRMQKEEMTQQEKEQLRQKLQDLREMLRQQGQQGQGQQGRLRKFQGRAKGQQGQGQQGQGQQGQGQEGQGQEGQEGQGQGQQGQGQQGQGQGQGQGKGQGGQGGETWILGPNGEKIMMISKGQGQGGQGQGGQGDQPGGKGAGHGHNPNVKGAATNPKMGTQDTQVAGADSGQGPSRSEVILGAADRGFVGRGYKKVYTEYRNHAEEALHKDEIPGGYRSYVRRYFELIRPREAQ